MTRPYDDGPPALDRDEIEAGAEPVPYCERSALVDHARSQGLANLCAVLGHRWQAEISRADVLIDQCRCCGAFRYLDEEN